MTANDKQQSTDPLGGGRPRAARRAVPLFTALFLSLPFLGASADPLPSPSGSAVAPLASVLSAALFEGTSKAPTEEAWRSAAPLSGVRMGRDAQRHECFVKRIAEWIRIGCAKQTTGRVDLLAGEKRDLTILLDKEEGFFGNKMVAQFSMHPGDRRVIQWIEPDLWWSTWTSDGQKWASGFQVTGPMFGMVMQVDWSAGPEPVISIF
jgi:hypothetical protein